ncbi:TetR/AcrR family transcriptional regulator [Nocardioides daejeonensis]|uniref:TetR/AcrR family transcriptional regulator n=1 Tax=Nocardioides daejeonensis TaxID=1046556 RepID=UPI000D74A25D|nr:TetR/AcrR family transcriptional regulator [Nocardioides daejeonensis]
MRGPTEPQQARRDAGPVTDRGAARKAALLKAARKVFERKGFIETRVADIVKQAKVSHGTFYTYFETKDAVFEAVSHQVIEEMVEAMTAPPPTKEVEERVHDSIERFVHAYRPHATMLGLMEQVGTFTPELRDLRLEARNTFVERTRRGMERLKAEGRTPADLDVEYTAESLGAMLEYICYIWFSLDRDFEETRIVDALAHIWSRALAPR